MLRMPQECWLPEGTERRPASCLVPFLQMSLSLLFLLALFWASLETPGGQPLYQGTEEVQGPKNHFCGPTFVLRSWAQKVLGALRCWGFRDDKVTKRPGGRQT